MNVLSKVDPCFACGNPGRDAESEHVARLTPMRFGVMLLQCD
jgi:hypothetical protein